MGSLTSLIMKEIKELVRDPKILLGVILMPLIIFPVMGSAINISQQSVIEAMYSASFAVYNEDTGVAVDDLLTRLYTNNTVITIEAASLEDALTQFKDTNASSLIYIKLGYSDNISSSNLGRVKLYANLKTLSIAETGTSDSVIGLINQYSYYLSIAKIQQVIVEAGRDFNPYNVRNPILITSASILKGNVLEVAPSTIYSLVMSQSIMLPVMIMMMLTVAIQMAATSIALEKEQKTLETLMTLPVGRMTILIGKLAGSVVVAIFGAVAYMIGFSYYMNSALSLVPQTTSMNIGDVGLGLEPIGVVLLGVNIFITLVSGLVLAASLATFTDNVRSAQSLTGILMIPIAIPSIVLMFSDLEMLPPMLQYILLAIPFTHNIIASKAIFLSDYFIVIRSIGYSLTFTIIIMYIAAKIFSTERIITSRFPLADRIKRIFKR